MVWQYLVYVLLLVLSALIVAAEMANYSTRRERLIQLSDDGNRSARMALIYLRAPRWYLAGSQLAATLATTVMGLMSSALFSQPLGPWLASVGVPDQYVGTVSFWTATLGLTAFLTIFVNLLPKRFAFAYADEVAVIFAKTAWIWIKTTRPFLAALNWVVDRIAAALGVRETGETNITESDILTFLREGRKDRLIDPHEMQIVRNALALSDRRVDALMTPRDKVVWIDLESDDDEDLLEALRSGRSQIPVAKRNLDEATGYIRSREFLASERENQICELGPFVRPAVCVPKNASALDTLNQMREAKSRLAFVVEDHGHIVGLVSLNDLVEEVIGDLEPIK